MTPRVYRIKAHHIYTWYSGDFGVFTMRRKDIFPWVKVTTRKFQENK